MSKSNCPSKGRDQLNNIEITLQEIGHWKRLTTIYHEWMEANVLAEVSFRTPLLYHHRDIGTYHSTEALHLDRDARRCCKGLRPRWVVVLVWMMAVVVAVVEQA